MLVYKDFPLICRPFRLWRFTKPRIENGSAVVVIGDTFFEGNPKHHWITIVDVKDYAPGENNQFTKLPAEVFYQLYERGAVVQYFPK